MAVGSVQDVMLAAVAVSSMQSDWSTAQPAPEGAAQETAAPASAGAAGAQRDAAQKTEEKATHHEKLTEEQTAYITKKLNEIMSSINVNLQFQYHKEVNVMSVRMLDKKTGEVLREVPPEAMVEHMIKVHDWIGAFLDKTA